VLCKRVNCVRLSTSSGIQNNTSSSYHREPILSFSHYVNDLLLQDAAQNQTNIEVGIHERLFLDVTFGTGKHSAKLLASASSQNIPIRILSSALSSTEYEGNKEMTYEDSRFTLIPTKSTICSKKFRWYSC